MAFPGWSRRRDGRSAEDPVRSRREGDPIQPARDEEWASARDPMQLDPDASGPPQFVLRTIVLLILVAALLALCSVARSSELDGRAGGITPPVILSNAAGWDRPGERLLSPKEKREFIPLVQRRSPVPIPAVPHRSLVPVIRKRPR